MKRALLRALALAFAALPFGFGIVRAVRTGEDVRYVWVALASACGAALILIPVRNSGGAVAVAAAAGACATVAAVAAAMIQGTVFGTGLCVVALSFGACFAVAAGLDRLAAVT